MKNSNYASDMLKFIDENPACFQTVISVSEILKKEGFSELFEKDSWNLKAGKKYFVTRNGSSLIAFTVPEKLEKFLITASHTDSPCFKIKENPELTGSGCVRLNVEKYGGMLMNQWFDRPLSFAGRVVYKSDSDSVAVKTKAIAPDSNVLMIPSLAIHMNRNANQGHEIDVQSELMPVISAKGDFKFKPYIAALAGVKEEDILGYDLFLCNRDKGTFWGAENEFISSPRLDDLECVWTTLQGFIQAQNKIKSGTAAMYAVFDNEEVGSQSRQGAGSTFLQETMRRINLCLKNSEEDFYRAASLSFMLSADNAHAVHPNYASCADPVNRPAINGGPVLKFNASQKYTSDAVTGGIFKQICKKAGVPCQIFTNNSNIAGGSTLGNISNSQVSMACADIGLAQWAMHSPNESAGALDVEYMVKAISEFYSSAIQL